MTRLTAVLFLLFLALSAGAASGPVVEAAMRGDVDTVRELLRDRGFRQVTTRRDLAGLERTSGGCWHAE